MATRGKYLWYLNLIRSAASEDELYVVYVDNKYIIYYTIHCSSIVPDSHCYHW